MEDISKAIRDIQVVEIQQFLATGDILHRADASRPWAEEGMTRRQWLAGEGIPLRTANQARDLWLISGAYIKELEGLTLNKLKLILPRLKELQVQGGIVGQLSLVETARGLMFNDLKDFLSEGNAPEHEHHWVKKEKVYWECDVKDCGSRTYIDPSN